MMPRRHCRSDCRVRLPLLRAPCTPHSRATFDLNASHFPAGLPLAVNRSSLSLAQLSVTTPRRRVVTGKRVYDIYRSPVPDSLPIGGAAIRDGYQRRQVPPPPTPQWAATPAANPAHLLTFPPSECRSAAISCFRRCHRGVSSAGARPAAVRQAFAAGSDLLIAM